jgi:hypothetical protein
MPIQVRGPDGVITKFPDGTPDAKINEVMASIYSAPKPADTSAARGVALGAMKPLDNLARAAMNIPGVAEIDKFGQRLGFPGANEAVASNDAARDANTRKGMQLLGNVVGTAPTLALPGGAIAQGAAGGALLSDATDAKGLAVDTVIGGVGGKAGELAVRGVGAAIAPKVSKNVKALVDAKIPLTIGQAVGGATKAVEDRLAGFPIVGDVINSARSRGVDAFNRKVISNALENINVTLPDNVPTGRDAVAFAGDAISDAYNKLVPRLTATPDATFATALSKIEAQAKSLPGTGPRDFRAVVGDDVLKMLKSGNTLTGEGFKTLESRLSKKAATLAGGDAYQRMVGEEVSGLLKEMRGLLMRSNPAARQELKAINRAFAEQVRIEKAAIGAMTPNNPAGAFTPKQYSAAVKASDTSARKSAVARGRALGQGFADAASDVLPNAVPDSGTAGRAAVGLLASGAAGTLAGISPTAIAGAGLASIPYTRAGQATIGAIFSPGAKRIAARNFVERAAPAVGAAAPALIAAQRK